MTEQEVIEKVKNYEGQHKFLNSLKEYFFKKGRLTYSQVNAAKKTFDYLSKSSNEWTNLDLDLEDETIKIGRFIAGELKKEHDLQFLPMVLDVTKVITVTKKAVRFRAKLTKQVVGECKCCGRELTDDMSKISGIGPVCAKNMGVKHPKTKENVKIYLEEVNKKIDELGEFEFWTPKKQIKVWDGPAGAMMSL